MNVAQDIARQTRHGRMDEGANQDEDKDENEITRKQATCEGGSRGALGVFLDDVTND